MKKLNFLYILLVAAVLITACSQERDEVLPTPTPIESDGVLPSAGSADFSKFIAVGNSLTAGTQGNALFTAGQDNSLPAILATQFALVGGGEFNQPDINSVNGFNPSFSDLANGIIAGRLVLLNPANPAPGPLFPGDLPTPFTGDKSALNNFGVPGIILAQALIPNTGTPGDPFENGLYTRFASAPGTSTIIGDAVAAQGSFFMFWLGNNDVLGYATTGGDGSIPITDVAAFEQQYTAALQALTTDPDIQGVVCNIPDITSIPFFTVVPYNAIPFGSSDQATIDATNGAYAAYNGGLAAAQAGGLITADEVAARTINFGVGANAIVIEDEALTDLSVLGLPSIRQTTASDFIILNAGSILGTLANPNDPTSVWGVGVPLPDNLVLTATEAALVDAAVNGFNAAISNSLTTLGLNSRVALADTRGLLADLTANQPLAVNGLAITGSFAPVAGLFSADGVHPNSRGYAYAAHAVIDAINEKFGANVPKPNLGDYPAAELPQ